MNYNIAKPDSAVINYFSTIYVHSDVNLNQVPNVVVVAHY